MMACRRRVSVSFWATAWSCTIPIRPTWATGGRIPRSTTILRSFTRRHYGWGSTCSLTPWARRGDRHCPSAAAARRAARPRPRRSRAAHERGRRVCDRGSGVDARAARRGGGGGVAPDRGDSGRRGVAGAPGGTPRRGRRRGAAGRDDRRYSRGERGGRARAGGERRSERGALGAGGRSSRGGGRARGAGGGAAVGPWHADLAHDRRGHGGAGRRAVHGIVTRRGTGGRVLAPASTGSAASAAASCAWRCARKIGRAHV